MRGLVSSSSSLVLLRSNSNNTINNTINTIHRLKRASTAGAKKTKKKNIISIIMGGPPLPSKSIAHAQGYLSLSEPTTLSFWIDYACPFSARLFKRMHEEVMPHYAGENIRFEFYHQVQPWHVASGIMHETSLAVAEVCGEDAFWQFSKELFEKRESYTDIYTFDATRHELTEDILNQCLLGQSEEKFEKVRKYARLNKETEDKNGGTLVTQQMKFHIKLGRQLGIHVSPTCCLNGLVCDTSSSWTLEEWKAFLDPHVK
jgi:protein-disulfide isomerase